MTQRVTIRDVAEQAKVSVGSVSRALNNYPHVSSELRERVLAAASDLKLSAGFPRQWLAPRADEFHRLPGRHHRQPRHLHYLRSRRGGAGCQRFRHYVVSSRNQAQLDVACLRLLASRQVSGLIVSSAAESSQPASHTIKELGLPTVLLDRQTVPGAGIYAVQSDHDGSMRAAIDHLVSKGHRDIGFIGGPEGFYPTRQRYSAYKSAMAAHGLPLRPQLARFASFTETDALAEALLLLRSRPRPSALVVAGNIILSGALTALNDLGVRVGKDIALIAGDDINLTRLYRPPISAIQRDLSLLGVTAARLLLQGMQNPNGERAPAIKLPTRLVVRASSDFAWAAG